MKRFCLLLIILTAIVFTKTGAQDIKKLKKVLELKIPREGGANAASVAWHPVLKKYYASMAGNASFFIGVYSPEGKLLCPASQKTMFDVRGLWYNPNTKTLQMNGYKDFGWGEYKLDAKGFPLSVTVLHAGTNQPDDQSVGAFNPKDKMVYFFNEEGNVDKYDYKDATFLENIGLHLGVAEKDADDMADNYEVLDLYNSSIIYTGIPGAELGLLNYENKEIELYNLKTGYLVRKLGLPDDAPVHDFLDFSYSNGIYWLFDTEARIWKGYK
jgi:hypothetical protein